MIQMRNISIVLTLVLILAAESRTAARPTGTDVFSADRITAIMHKVNDYQIKHPWRFSDRNWIRATWYTGVMAFHEATGDEKLLAQAVAWAKKHKWQVGTEPHPANRLTCVQTYLQIYALTGDKAAIAPSIKYMDGRLVLKKPAYQRGWGYIDTLYVGPPAFAMMSRATGDKKYNAYMNRVFWEVADYLYDTDDGLFYRDNTARVKDKSPNGKKVLWSRGNGWIIAGLPRILRYLPKDNPNYKRYEELLKTMAASLARRQGSDGLWRANLGDDAHIPTPESSGTGFFTYAMAWGVNNGVLDRKTYLPVVHRAWKGLCGVVDKSGKVCWGQYVGRAPKTVRRGHSHEYVTGTFLLAGSEMLKMARGGAGAGGAVYPYDPAAAIKLSDKFKSLKAPGTDRRAIQLTSGKATCYPLYYFIPSITQDLKYLVYHRAEAGEVQLHRLNLQTGESVQITTGDTPKTGWDNWCTEAGRGVLDHRSVLNVAAGQVVYFTGEKGDQVRAVDLATLKHTPLFTLTEGYRAAGQNCITPDGKWFAYIESPIGSRYRRPVKGKLARVVAYNFESKERRVLCKIGCHIHHVIPYDNQRFIFCHPPNGMGMLMTDLTSGKYKYLRAGDPGAGVKAGDNTRNGHVCHFVTTARGIVYEVIPVGGKGNYGGLYDPLSRSRFEFPLPRAFGYTHTGWDPQGRLWFWEDARRHHLVAARSISAGGSEFFDLTGEWRTYGRGQKSHFHPQLTPDRKWIMFVGGDSKTKTNHIFLLDASDLKDTRGISRELLSKTGDNNIP